MRERGKPFVKNRLAGRGMYLYFFFQILFAPGKAKGSAKVGVEAAVLSGGVVYVLLLGLRNRAVLPRVRDVLAELSLALLNLID